MSRSDALMLLVAVLGLLVTAYGVIQPRGGERDEPWRRSGEDYTTHGDRDIAGGGS